MKKIGTTGVLMIACIVTVFGRQYGRSAKENNRGRRRRESVDNRCV